MSSSISGATCYLIRYGLAIKRWNEGGKDPQSAFFRDLHAEQKKSISLNAVLFDVRQMVRMPWLSFIRLKCLIKSAEDYSSVD
jgi:hypothetical protein